MQRSLETQPYLLETKPATEWLLGRPIQKVMPKEAHAIVQLAFAAALRAWALGRGQVGVEWRLWLAPPGEIERYLVPDIAYISFERRPRATVAPRAETRIAPDVAVEIRSPDDRNINVMHKIDVYLRAGTSLVIIVDPTRRTCTLHDAETETIVAVGERLDHAALPGFSLDLSEIFGELDP